ncbi:Sodium-potassium/proton antiporter ChaA [Pantoea sp. Nvir]|nr:Sodium-potassium/proton antiporter ChaA [Pantoea sp. Nvir]
MAPGNTAPVLMRDTLYYVIMIVTGGMVGFSLLLSGRKFVTQHLNLIGVRQYLIAISPLAILIFVFPNALSSGNFTINQKINY